MTDIENTIATPAAARDFVKKAAEAAKERATTFHANAEKATANVEQTLVSAVGEVAKLTRQAQQAAYEDAEAFFAGVGKLAAAQSVGEAVQVYVDYLRGRADVATARTRAAGDYVGKLWADGAKTVQDNVAKASAFAQNAA
jgi:phasin